MKLELLSCSAASTANEIYVQLVLVDSELTCGVGVLISWQDEFDQMIRHILHIPGLLPQAKRDLSSAPSQGAHPTAQPRVNAVAAKPASGLLLESQSEPSRMH